MSAKVLVLESHQHYSDKPTRSVKRSVAALLVRRNLARQISKLLIQLVVVREANEILSEQRAIRVKEYDPADGGPLNAPRGPEGLLLHYPLKKYESCIYSS